MFSSGYVRNVSEVINIFGALAVNIGVFISSMLTSNSVTEFKDEMGRVCSPHKEK
jgi:hypothetical protein